MNTALQPAGHVVLPTTLVPNLLADAASLLTGSATSTVQDAMTAYQQAMLLLVRWYEAGQLEGRGGPSVPPRGGMPMRETATAAPVAVVPSVPAIVIEPESPSMSVAPVAAATPSAASIECPSTAHEPAQATNAGESAMVATAQGPSMAATQPAGSVQPSDDEVKPSRSLTARPFLPASAPPLEGPPPSDALGHAARLAITRRYGADATDPGA